MVKFKVTANTTASPAEIIDSIFEVSNWHSFQGWGPIPSIASVELVRPTDSRIGATFKVKDGDGSTHEETVLELMPNQLLTMRMDNFSPPLDKIADHFIEIWRFRIQDGRTLLEREFNLHPKNFVGEILLRPIGYALRKAVQRHTQAIVR